MSNMRPTSRPLSRTLLFASVIALAAIATACGSPERTDAPRIVVTPSSLIFNSVPLGSEDRLDLMVTNEGEGTLRVTRTRVETDTDFVALTNPEEGEFEIEPGGTRFISVSYIPTEPRSTSGELVFVTNDPQSPQLRVEIETPRPTPAPAVVPAFLDFGVVGVNTEGRIDVELRNIGLAPLIVCDAFVTGSPEVTTDLGDAIEAARGGDSYVTLDLYDFDTGLPTRTIDFSLFYVPTAPGTDTADLVLQYDLVGDASAACAEENIETVTYPITGSAGTPLLQRDPCPLDFRERAIDVTHSEAITLTNLGELDVEIFDIRLDADRSAISFGIDDVPELPLSLSPDDNAAFVVNYRPTQLTAEAGVVVIEHSDSAGDRVASECRLAGVGVENDCPVAVAEGWVLEDPQNRRGASIDWALPLQTLILDGSASYDPASDAIVDYIWEVVEAPDAAINGIRSFSGDPSNPALAEYFLPLAGRYQICLSVIDSSGLECETSCIDIVAIPEEAIAIELTWDNPSDPDQTDSEGSDVDLHFVKMPNAWFDPTFDTFYGNDSPLWSPESPSLDIDDTDGVGPETIQMDDPENCQWYAIGAHYYREAFGTAWPSVRIYINGREQDLIVNQPLFENDYFWDVARVHWPSGTVVRVNQVIEAFDSSAGIAPPTTDEMRTLGLCGTDP